MIRPVPLLVFALIDAWGTIASTQTPAASPVVVPTRIEAGQPFAVELVGINEGVAPTYKDWAVELALIPEVFDLTARVRLPIDLRTWLPGPIQVKPTITLQAPAGRYVLAIGIIDPMTKRPAVEFANQGETRNGWFVLGPVEVVGPVR